MRKILWIVCVAAVAACVSMPSADHTAPLQAELDRVRTEFGFPGMTAAYLLGDGTGGAAASGMADVEAGVPMTKHSRMLAASIGKSFVAALTVALALEKRLTLDEPVSRWLGTRDWFDRLPNHESITLRHLLTHSAGLPDHVHMNAFAAALANTRQVPDNPFPPERLVAFVLDKPALFSPGQGWAYSDTGYILVGLIVETVTGHSLFDELCKRFLLPLELSDTTPADRRDLDGLAAGYMSPDNVFNLPAKTFDRHGRLQWHPAVEWAGGGLVSTSPDLARWGAALFTGEAMAGDYLPELLSSVPINPDSADYQYGIGVAIATNGRFGPVYGHAGWIPGYTSSLRHYPEIGVTIAFQINTDIGIIDSDAGVLRIIEERLAQLFIE
jgi:D-alanyl-D-alanine carboxypeptidase